jgi:hypothetical protein
MGLGFDDDLVGRMGPGQHGREVRHRATGHQDGRLLAHQAGRDRLELVHGRIQAIDVVAKRRAGDRVEHVLCRQCGGVVEADHR